LEISGDDILTKRPQGKLSLFSELYCMLRQMEQDVGLQELSGAEVDVFLAAHAATGTGGGGSVTSDQIRQHELAASLAQATYHRALKSLVSMGLLEKADGYKTRHYVVRENLTRS
jgi:hypothetical protein